MKTKRRINYECESRQASRQQRLDYQHDKWFQVHFAAAQSIAFQMKESNE